ncbi:MAG: radical SAM protein, partial [Candidatus Gastranaerophilales bacterium]|nr:radical SAM protein [Candidatus Gastranaerophilales bacterium]
YTYPSMINNELISAIKNCDKVVKYLDIPLQHSHPDIIERMNRPRMNYRELISKIRKEIPDITLRTSLIVGFPGETEEEFNDLVDFVKEVKFDRLGVFEFSREKDTQAYSMKPQISAKVKKQRKKVIMELQSQISKEKNESFIGKKIPVLIETIISNGEIIARSFRDAPEIDGLVYIKTDKVLSPGDVEFAEVYDASEYDLFAKI